jgi:hypothetical protein
VRGSSAEAAFDSMRRAGQSSSSASRSLAGDTRHLLTVTHSPLHLQSGRGSSGTLSGTPPDRAGTQRPFTWPRPRQGHPGVEPWGEARHTALGAAAECRPGAVGGAPPGEPFRRQGAAAQGVHEQRREMTRRLDANPHPRRCRAHGKVSLSARLRSRLSAAYHAAFQ